MYVVYSRLMLYVSVLDTAVKKSDFLKGYRLFK